MACYRLRILDFFFFFFFFVKPYLFMFVNLENRIFPGHVYVKQNIEQVKRSTLPVINNALSP